MTLTKRSTSLSWVLGALIVLASANPHEVLSIPGGFNVQGRLVNSAGVNRDGTGFVLEFAVYDEAQAGTLLWQKTFDGRTVAGKTFNPINVRNGQFQINLGDPANAGFGPLGQVFASTDSAYLEITVLAGPGVSGPEPPLVPRQQLVSVPFAFKAQVAEQVLISPLPAGTVLPFAAEIPPAGFLECNGAAVSRTTFAGLFSTIGTSFGEGDGATTFNLPDLRGNFIRGWDHGAGRDPDAADRAPLANGGQSADNVGSFQQDEFKSHNHPERGANNVSLSGSGFIASFGAGFTGLRGGSETRSKNVYLMYIIKF